MAPQRRLTGRAPESGGAGAAVRAEERRHCSSDVKDNIQKDSRRKWLTAAFLVSSAMLGYLLSRSYLFSEDGVTEVLAHHGESIPDKFIEVPCSEDYDSHKRFEGCTPRKCGRGITDAIINREEAEQIRRIAERGLSLGGSDGGIFHYPNYVTSSLFKIRHHQGTLGLRIIMFTCYDIRIYIFQASILDLHSGALSLGKHFVNMYRYFNDKIHDIFTDEDFQLYRDVRLRIQQKIALAFGISSSSMYLTKPTFFSRINNSEAKTTHDEYWHPHIDKVTYGSFDYTSLLYLSDYAEDFGGGRFVFMDEGANRTVEPRAGRVSFFTSGSENLHHVEKVHWGTRYAITISFTCNPDHGIRDPVLT
ncbi:2-oxoglutarate and iron-dependent oxygenase domain-containing protein 3 [Crotalus adamanteus]|uniref:2-oxoglutarate and iron-dependent oxygenase domain-containing protein 3 n=1 Tax=Crotalus adamanteus TaxID=8729 RepID=A0AAW1BXN2_CROAD